MDVLAAALRQVPARFRRKLLVRVNGAGASERPLEAELARCRRGHELKSDMTRRREPPDASLARMASTPDLICKDTAPSRGAQPTELGPHY